MKSIADSYVELYESLIQNQERQSWAPELLMQLAMSFANISNQNIAIGIAEKSLKAWLELRDIEVEETDLEYLILKLKSYELNKSGRDYIDSLNLF